MRKINFMRQVFFTLLLGFLSVLSISGTIAMRNALHVLMLGILFWCLVVPTKRLTSNPLSLAHKIPLSVYAWRLFLILFPIWAEDSGVAWFNLRGQWGVMILTWLLAFGAVAILGAGYLGLWCLAVVSAVPVLIHLILLLMSWAGLLRPIFYEDPSLRSLWLSIYELVTHPALWKIQLTPFPMGFRGIEPLHFNIGHAANQSIGLAMVCMLQGWSTKNTKKIRNSGLLIILCFLSVLIAGSRGAVLFGFLLVVGAFVGYAFSSWMRGINYHSLTIGRYRLFGGLTMLIVLFALVGMFFNAVRTDERWYTMWDKLTLGWMMDNPTQILCKGLSEADEKMLVREFGDKGSAYVEVLKDGLLGQDGGRVLLMRSGKDLALDHPWGLDGSRQAYEKRIEQACGHPPALAFAHAHQGWINLSLALGWLGILLFSWVLLSFIQIGLRLLSDNLSWSYGLALLLLSFFWLFRGMTDAVFQDHYMQMLAFYLLYILLSSYNEGFINS